MVILQISDLQGCIQVLEEFLKNEEKPDLQLCSLILINTQTYIALIESCIS